MPIIPISSDTPEVEQRIAEAVAGRLGYRLLGREILADIAGKHDFPVEKLTKALDETPGFFGLGSRARRELMTHIQTETLERLMEDEIVCYGLAAHLYLSGVSHALRVRILTGPRSGFSDTGEEDKQKKGLLLKTADAGRRRWSREVFRMDETDPSIYDVVLNLDNMEEERAVGLICDAAGDRKYQPMTYSRKSLADKVLACRVKQKLLHRFPDVRVSSSDGTVVVRVQSLKRDQRKKQEAVRELTSEVEGVRYVEVHVIKDFFGSAATSER